MAAMTIRNLPDETHRALKLRAKLKGKSTEAEVRAILEEAVMPKDRIRVGSELAAFGRLLSGLELEIRRDPAPIEAADFE